MRIHKAAATAVIAMFLAVPFAGAQQVTYRQHEEAKHVQERHDAHHHTKAKIVAGSAIGGAVVGGLLGGPKGAALGAGVGAGGGLIANKVRKDHDVKKREEDGHY